MSFPEETMSEIVKGERIEELEHQLRQVTAQRDAAYAQLNSDYRPPEGVIGYASKHEIEEALRNGSQNFRLDLDSPTRWEGEAPYHWLVALCTVDSMTKHDIEVIEALKQHLTDAGCAGHSELIENYIEQLKVKRN